MQDKALAMLGMATKAGKVVSGEFSVEKAVKEGKAWLVPKRVLRTCVNFMSATLFFMAKKRIWGMQSAKSSGHPLRSQMKIWHRL